ncbi:hypothetical protein L6654_14690 [Bradyrhizobium sp. WYCCWR 13023]|uniref:Uncharacterized protein n=1 Tax=Bradyrhizobium zhengyangense TaxID=2911009 RepID=A0A9X1RB92_9BRAD|nr:hypothetical protein [Bradyrhizobium zhengyangense]MCG2627878.1 hypothetical protein [Bradyrhizobium zhengyangense]
MANRELIDRSVVLGEYAPVHVDVDEWADMHRPAVYRGMFSTSEVEHFLYLGSDISRHKYLVGKFGFRAPLAESFSLAALSKYGHPNFRIWSASHNSHIGCLMSFGLERSSIATKQLDYSRVLISAGIAGRSEYIATRLCDLLPAIKEVTTLPRLLGALAADTEPWPWFAAHPIARAAQIVAIGCHLKISPLAIREMLVPYGPLIGKNLQVPDLDSFLSGLINDLERR